MKRLAAVFALMTSLAFPALCQAITLGFSPSSHTKHVGSSVAVDVVVSGLNGAASAPQIVSAFDLDVIYDKNLLGSASVDFSPVLGKFGLTTLDEDIFYGKSLSDGRIDLWGVSLLSDNELQAVEGDSVTLATLNFTALAVGTTSLVLDPQTFPGIDVKGLNAERLVFGAVDDGSVTITTNGNQPVPEPSTFLLFGAGLGGFVFLRRKTRRQV